MEHWYVYYKLPAVELDATLPAMRALLAAVAAATGIVPRLQSRVDTPGGMATVMEIYPDIAAPDRFAGQLQSAVAASGLPAALCAGRRTERFRAL